MKRLAILLAVGLGLVAGAPAEAGSGNAIAIRQIETLRHVGFVNVIDVAARSDRFIFSKRAMHSTAPLTPLQVAIVSNPALMAAIRATAAHQFDLKSVYAARVEGYGVYLYMGDPPN